MAVQPDDLEELQGHLDALRRLIARYRQRLEEGAAGRLAAAYIQAIHTTEVEVAEIERRIAELIHLERAPSDRG
jgi:hypothetical protein